MAEEELTKRWERLHLSNEETTVIKIQAEDSRTKAVRENVCVVGRILSEKGVNNEAFRNTMTQVWRLEGWVRFKDLNDQCFLIEFQKMQDKEKVLSGRPWCFDRNLLTLQEVDAKTSINATQFRYEPFWVQCHNLPLAVMNEDIGEKLGNCIGHVIRVDTDSDGLAWGRCLRVRTTIDLHKPLLRGKWMEFEGLRYWISFKYERLQGFCFHCGVLYHKGKICSRYNLEAHPKENQYQYGSWLRAQPMNSSIFYRRKYGGNQVREEMKNQNLSTREDNGERDRWDYKEMKQARSKEERGFNHNNYEEPDSVIAKTETLEGVLTVDEEQSISAAMKTPCIGEDHKKRQPEEDTKRMGKQEEEVNFQKIPSNQEAPPTMMELDLSSASKDVCTKQEDFPPTRILTPTSQKGEIGVSELTGGNTGTPEPKHNPCTVKLEMGPNRTSGGLDENHKGGRWKRKAPRGGEPSPIILQDVTNLQV
ncbi:uncharacterized protein LOC122301714 [Carya illinoinensis]|uniref:uncharacterized protein LOC122301714 n=1 Tax=Carya illinoinensis TaxID=32201 RepID=UPI001C720297|nr:uncharacterized protein LOC122301714 [Carya illinoinensis]